MIYSSSPHTAKLFRNQFLEIPKFGTLNVLPVAFAEIQRPSPIQSFILSGRSQKRSDDNADGRESGPWGNTRPAKLGSSDPYLKPTSKLLNAKQLEEKLAELGGEMLVDTIPKWINGEIKS